LDLKGSLHVVNLDVGKELADEGGNDTDGRHDEREVDGIRGCDHAGRGGRHNQSSAGGLSKRAEKISAHTGDVTNVVTDVVSNGAWVLGGVFGNGSLDFTGEISTNISSLGVDTTTDSAEESNSGATETVARDELKEVLNFSRCLWVESGFVGEDEDLEDEKGKTDEDETEDLTALEGDLESFESVNVAEIGGLDVADGGNNHADIATEHASASADEEGHHSVGELVEFIVPGHVDGAKDDDGEESAENAESEVFSFQESDGTL